MGMGRRRTRDHHLPPRMLMRGSTYYYKGRGVYRALSRDWAEAYRLYLELDGPLDHARTVGDAIEHYMRAVLPGLKPATQREYQRYARRLREVFGETRLDAVDSSHVAQYLRRRSAPVEANREASMLSSVYVEAMAQGWVSGNPCRGVRRNREAPADIVPTAAEVAALLAAAPGALRCLLEVELATGARKEDLLALTLADWSDDGLALTQSKTGARLLYERTPELAALWARCRFLPRKPSVPYLFCTRLGNRYTPTGFDTVWQRLRERAGIRPDVTFHSLRAYVITEAERLHGMDYARRIAGHKSTSTTARYVRGREVIRVAPMVVAG